MYFQQLKKYFFDMLLLENIISDIVPNVSNKQETRNVTETWRMPPKELV